MAQRPQTEIVTSYRALVFSEESPQHAGRFDKSTGASYTREYRLDSSLSYLVAQSDRERNGHQEEYDGKRACAELGGSLDRREISVFHQEGGQGGHHGRPQELQAHFGVQIALTRHHSEHETSRIGGSDEECEDETDRDDAGQLGERHAFEEIE